MTQLRVRQCHKYLRKDDAYSSLTLCLKPVSHKSDSQIPASTIGIDQAFNYRFALAKANEDFV